MLDHISDSGFDGLFCLVKPINLAAPTCLAIMDPHAKQNRFFFFWLRYMICWQLILAVVFIPYY